MSNETHFKKVIYALLIIYLIAVICQFYFAVNRPAIITGKAATAQISIIILSIRPSLYGLENQSVYVGDTLNYYVNATDANDDNLTFYDDASFFNITNYYGKTALINFTATSGMVGVHDVNISVTDGAYWDWQVITFTISTVPAPPAPSPGAPSRRVPSICVPVWQCTEWGPCMPDGKQYRKCEDIDHCKIEIGIPAEIRNCTYVATCLDRILNGNETDIDCGGLCIGCEDGKKCKTDDDCINLCNQTDGICYSSEPIPIIEIHPIKIPIWKKIISLVSNIFEIIKSFFAYYLWQTILAILTAIAVILILLVSGKRKK